MQRLLRCRATALIVLACVALTPAAVAEPRRRPRPATQADVARLEQRLAAQQRRIDQMIALQRQYLQALVALTTDGATPPTDGAAPAPAPPPPTDAGPATPLLAAAPPAVGPAAPPPSGPAAPPPAAPLAAAAPPRAPRVAAARPARPRGVGTLVGKVTGAPGAVIYIEDIVAAGHGAAEMKQEGKRFLPAVLVVRKGTRVAFPNRDAIFHNVFSVSPDNSFDLGSYPQGESRTVTMSRVGVVTVYCNMHPQMVGHILVVPSGHYVRAGADGFFRLTNVPAGPHRVVAWAPNAKPAKIQTTVGVDEVVTIDVTLARTGSTIHTRSDGLPYGSYDR